jgi:hypothetical protein
VPAHPSSPSSPLPLRSVGEVALPGDNSRFDYASLDSGRGVLFVAHLGASEVIEVDVHSNTVVRTIPNLAQVHGVLVVPDLDRVFATTTGDNQMVVLAEDTGAVLNRAPTGQYPDGLAYDPKRGAVWTTNETGGSETVIDAGTAAVRGNVAMGGEAGNVAYDSATDRMLVAVQGRGEPDRIAGMRSPARAGAGPGGRGCVRGLRRQRLPAVRRHRKRARHQQQPGR